MPNDQSAFARIARRFRSATASTPSSPLTM
jgi:hypothetical protein